MKLSRPIAVRLSAAQDRDLRNVSNETGLGLSKLVRLTVAAGLQEIREKHALPRLSKTRRSTRSRPQPGEESTAAEVPDKETDP